jgi:RND family efflux transporter MFP subunit
MRPTVAALLALLIGLPGCKGEPEEQGPIIRPVRTTVVESTGERVRTLSGTVHAGTESRMSFKVAGTVEEVAVAVGDRVEAGQLIARVDASDYELAVEQARAALLQAQAQARGTESQYERTRMLYVNNDASKAQLDQARAADESAQAMVSSAYKRLELARAQVGYTRLLAVVDGAVADVQVTEGENVGSGSLVAVLTSGSQPEVHVAIPEALIGSISEGDVARVGLSTLGGEVCEATVTEVGVSSMGTLTTFPVTVRIDEKRGDGVSQAELISAIRPGMAAEVSFVFHTGAEERLLVPPVAIGEDRDGRFAFVVEPDAEEGLYVTRRCEVRSGEITGEGLEILEGLEAGQVVVTAGVGQVQDGMTVKLLPGATAPQHAVGAP